LAQSALEGLTAAPFFLALFLKLLALRLFSALPALSVFLEGTAEKKQR